MRLFRAIGLILFLLAAKTILLASPYQEFERTLSTFFQTTTTGLQQAEKLLTQPDFEVSTTRNLAVPQIDFSYRPQ